MGRGFLSLHRPESCPIVISKTAGSFKTAMQTFIYTIVTALILFLIVFAVFVIAVILEKWSKQKAKEIERDTIFNELEKALKRAQENKNHDTRNTRQSFQRREGQP